MLWEESSELGMGDVGFARTARDGEGGRPGWHGG